MPEVRTVGLLLPNCPEYPVIFAGAMHAGVRLTSLNPAYTPRNTCTAWILEVKIPNDPYSSVVTGPKWSLFLDAMRLYCREHFPHSFCY